MIRSTWHALFVLLLSVVACGGGYTPPPLPTCTSYTQTTSGGRTFTTWLSGAIRAKLSADSPKGPQPRFFGQVVLTVDLTAASGPNCHDLEVQDIFLDVPDKFLTASSPGWRLSQHLYFDSIDKSHELTPYSGVPSVSGLFIPGSFKFFKPGDTHKLIYTIDSTYFVPVTQGQISLSDIRWRAPDVPGQTGRGSIESSSLREMGNSITSPTLIFDRTLEPICAAVEDKIAAIRMPMSGWTCQGKTKDFLVLAAEDLKDCRLFIPSYGQVPVTPEQIFSPTEFRVPINNGMDFIPCTHP